MPNNDDVVKVALTPEEQGTVTSKPVETKAEVKPAETVTKEVTNDTEKVEPVKEVKKKSYKFDDVFKVKEEEKTVEKEPLNENERKEYEELRLEKIVAEHKTALNDFLEEYTEEEREIVRPLIDKLTSTEIKREVDIFNELHGTKLNARQKMFIIKAIAAEEGKDKLEKVRQKAFEAKMAEVKNAVEVKKTVTNIGDLKTPGETDISPAERRRNLIKKAGKGGSEADKAIAELLYDENEMNAIRNR